MSAYLHIRGTGGMPTLEGTLPVNGAKNAAVKVMASALLFRDGVHLEHVPDIEDVRRMAELLSKSGLAVEQPNAGHYTIAPRPEEIRGELDPDITQRMRASVVATAPMLARFGEVRFPHPGGCVIGERPIDIFCEGYERMGAEVHKDEERSSYIIRAPKGKLTGASIFMRTQSVTATEAFIMAAVLAEGRTVLKNAATEPEIVDLARFLKQSGARIVGEGTHTITIEGGELLHSGGNIYRTIPDRIEAGSFVILGALAGKEVTVAHCVPEHLEALIETLRYIGVDLTVEEDRIHVRGTQEGYRPVDIVTHEYPGFPTDLQAPMTILLTQAEGESTVFETIFEGRLTYTESVKAMGADITMMDPHRILVRGKTPLTGKELESPDLRAGLAYIIAALVAPGESVIHNVGNIDRGYTRIEERLQRVGADISRITA